MIPEEFFAFAKKHKARVMDLKFTDLLGTWQQGSRAHEEDVRVSTGGAGPPTEGPQVPNYLPR
jgi:hypothetical protein